MTEHQNEHISALMDGELDGLPANLSISDASARTTWHRYHMISDVMHRRALSAPNTDLSVKISGLINNEPTILAPSPVLIPAYLKPVAGFAIAASVAAVALLGVQFYQEDNLVNNQAQVAVIPTEQPLRQPSVAVQPPAIQSVSQNSAAVRPVQMEIQSNAKISRYIMQHNEYQSNVGMQGVMPHVRLVTIDANE